MKIAAVIPDCHIPYEDKRCFDLTLAALHDLKDLEEIVILGDFGDFYAISSHGKHPEAQHLLLDEVDAINMRLDMIDAMFPGIKKIFIEGNHENRLERYLTRNAPALFGITCTEYLFQFNMRPNWTFIPYTKRQHYSVLGTRLGARHEPFSASSAKASLTNSLCDLVYGHIHRIEEFNTNIFNGRSLSHFCPGWLGDERYDKIFGYAVDRWQKGFSLVYSVDNTDSYSRITYAFDEQKRVIVHGRLYK